MPNCSLGVWSETTLVPASASLLRMTPPQVRRAKATIARIRGRRGPNITVWYGVPGLGKTATAWILCRIIHETAGVNAAYLDAPTPRGDAHDERMVLRSILSSGVGRIPDTMFRSRSDDELADMILTALFAQEVRLLVIDEAGRLGFRGLEAIGRLVDRAVRLNEDFHVLLVGMERLPETLRSNSRVRSRVAAWEHFSPLTPEVFGTVLLEAYPTVLGGLSEPDRCEVVEALHEASDGSLREVLAVLSEAAVLQAEEVQYDGALGLVALLRLHRQSCERITAQQLPASTAGEGTRHQTAFARAGAK